MDLDKFKPINDTYGHLSGDSVLHEFAVTCRNNLRTEDIFGRYGGDEFVIILLGLDASETVQLAERLKRAVEAMTVVTGERKIKVTASFGVVAEQAGRSISLKGLLQKADEALYEAKKAGGNRVCISYEGKE